MCGDVALVGNRADLKFAFKATKFEKNKEEKRMKQINLIFVSFMFSKHTKKEYNMYQFEISKGI